MMQKMQYCLAALIISVCLIIPAVSFADGDTALHFGLSTIFGAAGESIVHYNTKTTTTERIVYGTLLGSLPGLGKEILDSTQSDNHFSGKDMAADVAGAFVGSVLANLINNRIQISIDAEQKKVAFAIIYEF